MLGSNGGVAAGSEAIHQLGVVVRVLRQLIEVHVLHVANELAPKYKRSGILLHGVTMHVWPSSW